MTADPPRKKPTVHDVARVAGVSLATVDRVLNRRPGVRDQTVQRVEDAVRELAFTRDLGASLLARARDLRLHFIIPDGDNRFMASLAAAVETERQRAPQRRLQIGLERVRAMDEDHLVAALGRLSQAACDCAIVVAIEAETVRAAIAALAERGVFVLTLVSDLPRSARRAFVGIDNLAAGRTAAGLLGRFCHRGRIGLIAGSLALRDHRERWQGFAEVMGREFPHLTVEQPREAHDSDAETEAAAGALIEAHPDLCGLYSIGAGNDGVLAALRRRSKNGTLRVVMHELNQPSRAGLEAGLVDAVLDQDPDGEIAAAVATARGLAAGDGRAPVHRFGIGIFLRDNLR